MSKIAEKLEKFVKENGREILSKFDAVLKDYDVPIPLSVLEARISYSPNPPLGQRDATIVYEDKYIIIINK